MFTFLATESMFQRTKQDVANPALSSLCWFSFVCRLHTEAKLLKTYRMATTAPSTPPRGDTSLENYGNSEDIGTAYHMSASACSSSSIQGGRGDRPSERSTRYPQSGSERRNRSSSVGSEGKSHAEGSDDDDYNGDEHMYSPWSPYTSKYSPSRNRHDVMDSPLLSPTQRGLYPGSPDRENQSIGGGRDSPGSKSQVTTTPTRRDTSGYWASTSPRKALYSPAAMSGQILPDDEKNNEEAMDLYSPGKHILTILHKNDDELKIHSRKSSRSSRKHASTSKSNTKTATHSSKRSVSREALSSSSTNMRAKIPGNFSASTEDRQAKLSDSTLPAPHANWNSTQKFHPNHASNTKCTYDDDQEVARMLISLSPQREVPNHDNLLDSCRSESSTKARPVSPMSNNAQNPLIFGEDEEEEKAAAISENSRTGTAPTGASSSSSSSLRAGKENHHVRRRVLATNSKGGGSITISSSPNSLEAEDNEAPTPKNLSPMHTAAKFSTSQVSRKKGNSGQRASSRGDQNTDTSRFASDLTENSITGYGAPDSSEEISKRADEVLKRNNEITPNKAPKKRGRPSKNENNKAEIDTLLKTPPRQVKTSDSKAGTPGSSSNKDTTASDNSTSRKVSPYLGVSWIRASCRWRADSVINGKLKYLGCFLTEEEAACAVDDARSSSWDGSKKIRLNFPERQAHIPRQQKVHAIKSLDSEGNKKSDYIGVVWDSKQGQWRARICVPDEKWIRASYQNRTSGSPTSGPVELQHFPSELEAARAVDRAKFDTYSRILNLAQNDTERAKVPKPRLNFPEEYGLRQPGRSSRSKAQRRIAKFSTNSPGGTTSDSMSVDSTEQLSPAASPKGKRGNNNYTSVYMSYGVNGTSGKGRKSSTVVSLNQSGDGADDVSFVSPATNPSPAKRRRKKKVPGS